LTITTASLPNGKVGVLYSQILTATGGTTPYTWGLASGTLPAGLALNALTGVISGTPPAAANAAPLTFKVIDSSSPAQTVNANLALTIAPATLTITTTSLASGQAGTAYSQTLTAIGGTVPYTWALTSGTLPAGLTLNSSTGLISGAPTTAANATPLIFNVTDSSSPPQTAASNLTLTTVLPFTVTFGASTLSIASPGGSIGTSVTIAPVGGFAGTVNLTCSVTYTGQGAANDPPTCSLSAPQINLAGSSGTSTLTVYTTPAASALWAPRTDQNANEWLNLGEIALAVAVILAIFPQGKRLNIFAMLFLLIVCLSASFGCGGGGGGSSSSTLGTTAGSYTVAVSATTGSPAVSLAPSAVITLSVQ
jgi:hypothetical protein